MYKPIDDISHVWGEMSSEWSTCKVLFLCCGDRLTVVFVTHESSLTRQQDKTTPNFFLQTKLVNVLNSQVFLIGSVCIDFRAHARIRLSFPYFAAGEFRRVTCYARPNHTFSKIHVLCMKICKLILRSTTK